VVLIGLVVSLVSKLWWHDKIYENNHFLGQRRTVMMTTIRASIGTPTMKVKKPREGEFCVTFSFWVLFCGGFFFFPLRFCQAQKVFYHQEYSHCLQIKHNIWFLPQSE
jgi:hypothetical protein